MLALPTSPASCKVALDSPLGIGMEDVIFLLGGRHITVLLYILFLVLMEVLRRLAGGCAVPLELIEGKGNRDACACVEKQLLN